MSSYLSSINFIYLSRSILSACSAQAEGAIVVGVGQAVLGFHVGSLPLVFLQFVRSIQHCRILFRTTAPISHNNGYQQQDKAKDSSPEYNKQPNILILSRKSTTNLPKRDLPIPHPSEQKSAIPRNIKDKNIRLIRPLKHQLRILSGNIDKDYILISRENKLTLDIGIQAVRVAPGQGRVCVGVAVLGCEEVWFVSAQGLVVACCVQLVGIWVEEDPFLEGAVVEEGFCQAVCGQVVEECVDGGGALAAYCCQQGSISGN